MSDGPDYDLLAKMASGEGGARTGVLKRLGYLEWNVTDTGRQALAVHRGVESARAAPLVDIGSFKKYTQGRALRVRHCDEMSADDYDAFCAEHADCAVIAHELRRERDEAHAEIAQLREKLDAAVASIKAANESDLGQTLERYQDLCARTVVRAENAERERDEARAVLRAQHDALLGRADSPGASCGVCGHAIESNVYVRLNDKYVHRECHVAGLREERDEACAALAEAVAEEREACAKVADSGADDYPGDYRIAEAIRARGAK